MIDWRRVLQEKRSLVLPLAIAAIVNLGVYFLVVYPLTARTASVEARAQRATVTMAREMNEFRAAEATRTGRARADAQLAKFYAEILPKDQPGARRITYLRLAKMAEDAGLEAARRTFIAARQNQSDLEQLEGAMVLTGDYRDVRKFLHTLETSPEFVIIRQVSLTQGERDAPLTLTLQLATFYRAQETAQ